MSATLLSTWTTPQINSIDAQLVLANSVLESIVQGIIEDEGRGVTQKFTTDTSGAQIRAIRIKPLTQEARELGASLSGGNFPTTTEEPTTDAVGLDVITTIDKPVDIAQVSLDMLPVDLLSKTKDNIARLVDKNVNAMTIAGKIAKTLGDFTITPTSFIVATDKFVDKIGLANNQLNNGDDANGIDVFPQGDRCIVIRSTYEPYLTSSATGVYSLGGSNFMQMMLANGQISPDTKATRVENGYIGQLHGSPVHMASDPIWTLAERYLGLPAGELAGVVGYVSSGLANSRAIAHNEKIKIIDAPNGQGVRLQPLYRMGFESWFGKGNAFIVTSTHVDPFAKLVGYLSTYVPKAKAPGSRATVALTVSASTKTITATVTGSTVGVIQYKWVELANIPAALTVQSFYAATAGTPAAGNGSGTATSGAAITATASVTKDLYLLALVITADGTVVIGSSGSDKLAKSGA